MMNKARILILDLETSPAEVYTWGLRDQNIGIEQIKHDQYCLMYCAKWLGESGVTSDTLINYPKDYKKNPRCDKNIALSVRNLLDQADIVIGQNSERFDLKWVFNMLLRHNIDPPSPYHSIDLLKVSRSRFYALSHRLDFRGKQLGLGGKQPHEGFRLWLGCMAGDKKAWATMESYCKRDVLLTEQYYYKLRPYITNHPNVNMFHKLEVGGRLRCPACGSPKLKAKGFRYTHSGKRQRVQCGDCRHYSTLRGKANNSTSVTLQSSM